MGSLWASCRYKNMCFTHQICGPDMENMPSVGFTVGDLPAQRSAPMNSAH